MESSLSLLGGWREYCEYQLTQIPFGSEALGELVLTVETFSGIDFNQRE